MEGSPNWTWKSNRKNYCWSDHWGDCKQGHPYPRRDERFHPQAKWCTQILHHCKIGAHFTVYWEVHWGVIDHSTTLISLHHEWGRIHKDVSYYRYAGWKLDQSIWCPLWVHHPVHRNGRTWRHHERPFRGQRQKNMWLLKNSGIKDKMPMPPRVYSIYWRNRGWRLSAIWKMKKSFRAKGRSIIMKADMNLFVKLTLTGQARKLDMKDDKILLTWSYTLCFSKPWWHPTEDYYGTVLQMSAHWFFTSI